ncbi:hypothetical protein KDA00_03770 [Candidatus Saccharibacteria bacterium]|nr:hypothetical protein [Candidatus Saccharibacteria bacterium]
MKASYESVLIIYNPASTGGKAKTKAVRLTRQLKRHGIENVKLRSSDYPGHSEDLAYSESLSKKNPLIISVSGDGGYNGVINGVLRAQLKNNDIRPTAAILAAGNANDHQRSIAKRPLLWAITHSAPEPVDVLKLRFSKTTRYAHSYIGIGITAEASKELNEQVLTRWKDIKIITRNLLRFNYFTINANGQIVDLDSLVFSNVRRMSKVIKIGEKTDLHNGLFSLVIMARQPRLKFLYTLFKIILFGVKNPTQLSRYNFKLLKPQLAQLDGEPLAIPANVDIEVTIEPETLQTIR